MSTALTQIADKHIKRGTEPTDSGAADFDGLLIGLRRWAALLWILVFTLAGCLLLVIAMGLEFINAYSRDRSLHLAQTALTRAQDDLAFVSRDYAVWDEAVANLKASVDPKWAARTIGAWAYNEMNMQASAVIGSNGQLAFWMLDGNATVSPPQTLLTPELSRLAAKAQDEPAVEPKAVVTFLSVDGAVMMAAAAPVTSETADAEITNQEPRAVLVFMRRLDQAWLDTFSTDYLLADLALDAAYDSANGTALPLRNADGVLVAALTWVPARPGTILLQQAGPWFALLLIVGALAAYASTGHHRRISRAATNLVETLQQQNTQLQDSEVRLSTALAKERKANAVKGEFLAVMSHELRTPLNAVLGFSEVLWTEALGPVGSPKYIGYAHDIHDAGRHLLAMIDDILDFSRSEAGHLSVDRVPIDLNDVLQFGITHLQHRADKKSVTMVGDFADRPVMTLGDEGRLRQIVLNLLSNAIKASRPGGRIKARVRYRGEHVELRIIDQGIGIPADQIANIFNPFERVASDHDTYGDGIGLGLSIVQKLVAAHEGAIRILSKRHLGTIVEVRLARLARHEQPAAQARKKNATG